MHLGHEWGMQIDGVTAGRAFVSTVVSFGPGRSRAFPARFWCPGIERAAADDAS